MKTAGHRKQQRTAQSDGEEEREGSPYCPETPKEREGKAKLFWEWAEQRRQFSKVQEMQNAEVSELEHHWKGILCSHQTLMIHEGFKYKILLRPSGLSRQSVLWRVLTDREICSLSLHQRTFMGSCCRQSLKFSCFIFTSLSRRWCAWNLPGHIF